mmetsp:Transcript_46301/g.83670  ORF Transcript_46301/g.83670 Transcript_46301/m.83670 type:complete len:202 (-) Transcript_46301:262-867(-)
MVKLLVWVTTFPHVLHICRWWPSIAYRHERLATQLTKRRPGSGPVGPHARIARSGSISCGVPVSGFPQYLVQEVTRMAPTLTAALCRYHQKDCLGGVVDQKVFDVPGHVFELNVHIYYAVEAPEMVTVPFIATVEKANATTQLLLDAPALALCEICPHFGHSVVGADHKQLGHSAIVADPRHPVGQPCRRIVAIVQVHVRF